MKTTIGLISCVLIFFFAIAGGNYLHLWLSILPSSFFTHSLMLLLSGSLIYVYRNQIPFRLASIKLTSIPKIILIALGVTIGINFLTTFILLASGSEGAMERHFAFSDMTSLQFFFFIVICAPIGEEFLFRGFLQNMLCSFSSRKIRIFRICFSWPVIISGLLFGLSHFILLKTGASIAFTMKTFVFSTFLGITAGYFQEKQNNTLAAIIVHMTGNLPGFLATLLITLIRFPKNSDIRNRGSAKFPYYLTVIWNILTEFHYFCKKSK